MRNFIPKSIIVATHKVKSLMTQRSDSYLCSINLSPVAAAFKGGLHINLYKRTHISFNNFQESYPKTFSTRSASDVTFHVGNTAHVTLDKVTH